MTNKEYLNELVNIHNMIVDVSVKGDDAIRLGASIQKIRELIKDMNGGNEQPSSNAKV